MACDAALAAMIDSGVTNIPAVVSSATAISSKQTAMVALWTFCSPRAARLASSAETVIPPEHEPQMLTSSLPVMSRITSMASSSAAT
jgi:hypothetical protein